MLVYCLGFHFTICTQEYFKIIVEPVSYTHLVVAASKHLPPLTPAQILVIVELAAQGGFHFQRGVAVRTLAP